MTIETLELKPGLPVSLSAVEVHANATYGQTAAATAALEAATAYVETAIGRSLNVRVREASLDEFPKDARSLILPEPVLAITSVSYVDAAGGAQTMSTDGYTLVTSATYASVKPATDWPADASDVSVVYTNPTARQAVQAVKMLAAYWIEQREAASDRTVSQVPHAVDALILQLRGVMVH